MGVDEFGTIVPINSEACVDVRRPKKGLGEKAEVWSLYGVDQNGLHISLGDFREKTDAYDFEMQIREYACVSEMKNMWGDNERPRPDFTPSIGEDTWVIVDDEVCLCEVIKPGYDVTWVHNNKTERLAPIPSQNLFRSKLGAISELEERFELKMEKLESLKNRTVASQGNNRQHTDDNGGVNHYTPRYINLPSPRTGRGNGLRR